MITVTLNDLRKIDGLHVIELNEADEGISEGELLKYESIALNECMQRVVDKMEDDFIKFMESNHAT